MEKNQYQNRGISHLIVPVRTTPPIYQREITPNPTFYYPRRSHPLQHIPRHLQPPLCAQTCRNAQVWRPEVFSIAPADNLTATVVSSPEYPKIKRTGTRGLPPVPRLAAVGQGAFGADRPGQMTDPRLPSQEVGYTGRGLDPVPMIPRLPLPPEHCEA
jgi:hypothetical protein